jgi:DNA-binding NarL/FixJ family response regulator
MRRESFCYIIDLVGARMRILIVRCDKVAGFALGLRLEQEPDMDVVAQVDSSTDWVSQVEAAHPDIILIQRNSHCPPVAEELSKLQALTFRPKVVVLNTRPEQRSIALAVGADGFASTNDRPKELLTTLRLVYEGDENV